MSESENMAEDSRIPEPFYETSEEMLRVNADRLRLMTEGKTLQDSVTFDGGPVTGAVWLTGSQAEELRRLVKESLYGVSYSMKPSMTTEKLRTVLSMITAAIQTSKERQ